MDTRKASGHASHASTDPGDALRVGAGNAIFAWEWDLASGAMRWSENAAEVIGCPPEELPAEARNAYFFVAPEDLARVRKDYEDAAAKRQDVFASEFRGRGEAASARHYVAYARVLYDESGTPLRLVGITHDITPQRDAELEVRSARDELARQLALRDRLRALASGLVDDRDLPAVWAGLLDIASTTLGADYASLARFEPARKPPAEGRLRLLAHRGLHAESAAFWYTVDARSGCSSGRVLAAGGRRDLIEDVEAAVTGGDLEAYRRSGVRAVRTTPLHARDGRLLGTLSTYWRRPHRPSKHDLQLFEVVACHAADLMECAQTHAALRESEERFCAFMRATSEVVFRMSPDWSEMRQLEGRGFLPDTRQPTSGWVERYIPAGEREAVLAAIRGAVAAGRPLELEHRVIRPDHSLGWALLHAIPILDAGGEVVEWFGTARDVTRRKQVEERLARAARLSAREREVLVLLAGGRRTKEMAAQLGISPATVEVHRRTIMRKLRLHSVAGLTRFAIDSGIAPEIVEEAQHRSFLT